MDDKSHNDSHAGVWIFVLAVFIIGCIIYNISENRAKDDYQNAVDWTSCRRDYKKGLATMDECNKVKENGWVYVPR